MNQRDRIVSLESMIYGPPFGSAKEGENVGQFLDRMISFCKDPRLLWRAKFARMCGQRVECWLITGYPGYKMLECPHCGARACFSIVRSRHETDGFN